MNNFAIILALGALSAIVGSASAQSCLVAPVRAKADTGIVEANRSQGPRRTVVRRLFTDIRAACPTIGPVPVPVPPGPTPPPVPVVLPTPVAISPGSTVAPGPEVSLTPTFSWGAVSGATGYVLAIRDVASNAFVYPSTTGVGPPLAGTSTILPTGVLLPGQAYRWDLTAVNATSKSLPSANRYFTTALPAPVPPPAGGDSARVIIRFGNTLASMCGYTGASVDSVNVNWRMDTVTVSGRLLWRPMPSGGTAQYNSSVPYFPNAGTDTVTVCAATTGTPRRIGHPAVRMTTIPLTPPTPPAPVPVPVPVPPPAPTPPPTGIAAPELPRVVPEHRDPYPGRACTVFVAQGGDVSAALAAARGGTVVCLTTGTVYSPVQLPCRANGDTGRIVLRTGTTLPAEGTRMRPSLAANLAKIQITRNGEPAFTTCPGAFGYVVRGIEVSPAPGVNLTYTLVQLGESGPLQDTMDEVPQRLILSQMWIHGTTLGEMQRCVTLNSGATAIVDSWFSDCHGKGYDSQAIGGFNGPGPHLVRNNYLEGVGENVMWGGATPSISGLVAADITFQRNHVYTPLSWKGVWTKKNLLELKNAVRVLIEDNVFDGSWTDGQGGNALLFKSINDMGSCNWCRTTDVTVRRNLVKNAGGGIVFSGQENYNPFGSVDSVAKRFLIQDVVFDNINVAPYTGSGWGIQITGGASDIVFERTVLAGNINNTLFLHSASSPSPRTAFRSSVWQHGVYFATCDACSIGLLAMNTALPGFQWSGMSVVLGTASLNSLPAETTVVSSESQAASAATIRATVNAAINGVVVIP